MTTPHHSEPAREAVAIRQTVRDAIASASRAGASGWADHEIDEATDDLVSALSLSASPAPAASGGLEVAEEVGFVSAFLRIAAQRRDVPANVRLQILKAVDIIAALAAPAATGGAEAALAEVLAFIEDANTGKAPVAEWHRKHAAAITQAAKVHGRDHLLSPAPPTHPAPSETGASLGVKEEGER